MVKQTKNIITHEECKHEALKSVKSEIITYSILLAFSLLLYIPFFIETPTKLYQRFNWEFFCGKKYR